MEDFWDSLPTKKDREEAWESMPAIPPVVVAVVIVAGTIVGMVLLYLRNLRITRTKARRHFVKSASLLSEAQRLASNSPREAQVVAEQAIVEADLAIAIDPTDAAFHIVKSLALEVVGKSGQAIKELVAALSRPQSLTIPERSSTLVKKASLLSQTGMVHEAVLDLQESVALTPTNPRAQILLGEAYEKDGSIEKAIEAFNQAVLLNPQSPDAKVALERLKA